jgi:hypothetical protein
MDYTPRFIFGTNVKILKKMKTKTNQQTNLFKNFGFAGIALCAICCSLPIAGAAFGIGTLTMLAKYFEWAGIAAIVFAVAFFGVWTLRKKKAPSCDIDCDCKTENLKIKGNG